VPRRRPTGLAPLLLGCCAAAWGCGGSSKEDTPVKWSEVESKVDPKSLVKKSGKNFVPVEREERRRLLIEARRKMQE
jgi:hypothetical protein